MSILFDEDSSSFGPTSADPMLAGINGATDELRFASAIETGTEGPEDEVLKAAGADNGVDELLVPQNGQGTLNVGKSGAEILEDSSGGKSPPGEKDTLTGEEDDVVIGEADSLTGGSSERVEISPRSGLRDARNNTRRTARNLRTLNGSRSFSDFVGTTDTNDYYRFRVTEDSEFDLTLNGLSGDADVQLLNRSGRTITRSTRGGTSADSINETLDAGIYYIRVYPMSGVNTNYNLSISAESAAPPDGAGNTRPRANNIGTLNGSRSFSDFVGTADTNDYYRFRVTEDSEFDLTLNGLSADADVQLLNRRGRIITSSTLSGSSADSINETLDAGIYYIRVYPFRGVNTDYNLSMSVTSPDDAGNTRPQANNIGTLNGSRSFSDFVGTTDTNDYYRFRVTEDSEFDLTLNGLSGDADVQLLNRSGRTITRSTRGGTSADSINETLDAGIYYIRVYPFRGVNTDYNLSMSVTSPDDAGNTRPRANNIGTLNGSRSFSDFVGTTDTNDYYRFRVTEDSEFDLTLNGLSGDADVQLLNRRGRTITSSTLSGSSAENINETLDPGIYYIRVYPFRGVNTDYNLSMSVTSPDDAGNTRPRANNIGTLNGSRSFSDFVGTADTNDYYRFRVTEDSEFDLTLNGLSGDADVQLLNRRGRTITRSTRGGTSADSINETLDAGIYYIRVYPFRGVNTDYNLSISAESAAPPDGAGNNRPTARNLRTLNSSRSFSDFVGTADTNDYYRFRLTEDSEFDLTLNGLSGDADVQLLDTSGSTIASSYRGGSSAENIGGTLDSGTYYIRVYPYGVANTNYNLSISAESVIPADPVGNNMSNAYNLGIVSGSSSFSEFVGTADTNDYYRFQLTQESEFDLTLNGLSGDADVQLLDTSGNTVASSVLSGSSAENISEILDSGTYYIRIYPYGGVNTNYNLSLTAAERETDNTRGTARNIGSLSGSRSFSDFVGTTDTNDYYRFNLINETEFDLTLNGLSGDADVQLVDTSGNTVASSVLSGSSAENISEILDSGTYYIRIYPYVGVNTDYNLSLTASTFVPSEEDNTLGTARNIGSLSGSRSFLDSVSSSDTNDFYRFEVNRSGILTADLTGLSRDADIRLIKDRDNDRQIDRGEIEAWQWERGSDSESIRQFVTPGTYFLQVNSFRSQSTNYNLTTNFSAGSSDNLQFSIGVNFMQGSQFLTSQMRNAVEEAANFWENVISHSSLSSNHRLTIDVGGRDQGGRDRDGWITLASAGPRNWTEDVNGRWKPSSGVADINTNQEALENFSSNMSYFKGLMIHEFGHVLGIGTTGWNENNLINRSSATYNANTDAGWAYGELLGTFRPTAIPLTTGVGDGSDYAHWREQVFGDEIMTHAADSNYPLSQMTIASLRDMGWNVNYGAADNYSLPQRNVRNPRNGDRVEYLW